MVKKKILVVDDEEDILKLIENLLEPEGYSIIKVKNGVSALKKLKKIKPNLIIIDFFMPGMSGREVCEKIRADSKLKDLKVVFLTVAKFSKLGVEELKYMKVQYYIQKPFDNEDFKKKIKKII